MVTGGKGRQRGVVMMGTYGIKFTTIVLFWRTLTAQSICIYITDTPK